LDLQKIVSFNRGGWLIMNKFLMVFLMFVVVGLANANDILVPPTPPEFPEAGENSVTYSMSKGWNLLGNPASISIDTTLFDSKEVIWVFVSNGWNQDPSSVSKGSGFWVKNSADQNVIMSYSEKSTLDVNALSSGWNLLGAGVVSDNLSNMDEVEVVWKFASGAWIKDPSTIETYEGFWLKKK
jgi:hypothetical protein